MFSKREMFLMSKAMEAGGYYRYLNEWLTEVISDSGHTVMQHLIHDVELLAPDTACIVCNGESEKGKGCRNCGDILEGSDHE